MPPDRRAGHRSGRITEALRAGAALQFTHAAVGVPDGRGRSLFLRWAAMRAETLGRAFAARITGLDLERPVDLEHAAVLRRLASEYGVMVFPGFNGPSSACMKNLGDVFGAGFEGADLTNLDANGAIQAPDDPMARLTKGNEVWHVDMLAVAEPSLFCMIRAKELPSAGGQTQFADMTQLWPSLSEARRSALAGKMARHAFYAVARRVGADYPLDMVAQFPGTTHPIVVREPLSGLPVVFIGAHTERIIDSDEDVDALIAEATVPQNVFTHTWTLGDLVVWNNRRVVHRVTPYAVTKERRRLARYDVKGPRPVSFFDPLGGLASARAMKRVFSRWASNFTGGQNRHPSAFR